MASLAAHLGRWECPARRRGEGRIRRVAQIEGDDVVAVGVAVLNGGGAAHRDSVRLLQPPEIAARRPLLRRNTGSHVRGCGADVVAGGARVTRFLVTAQTRGTRVRSNEQGCTASLWRMHAVAAAALGHTTRVEGIRQSAQRQREQNRCKNYQAEFQASHEKPPLCRDVVFGNTAPCVMCDHLSFHSSDSHRIILPGQSKRLLAHERRSVSCNSACRRSLPAFPSG